MQTSNLRFNHRTFCIQVLSPVIYEVYYFAIALDIYLNKSIAFCTGTRAQGRDRPTIS